MVHHVVGRGPKHPEGAGRMQVARQPGQQVGVLLHAVCPGAVVQIPGTQRPPHPVPRRPSRRGIVLLAKEAHPLLPHHVPQLPKHLAGPHEAFLVHVVLLRPRRPAPVALP